MALAAAALRWFIQTSSDTSSLSDQPELDNRLLKLLFKEYCAKASVTEALLNSPQTVSTIPPIKEDTKLIFL